MTEKHRHGYGGEPLDAVNKDLLLHIAQHRGNLLNRFTRRLSERTSRRGLMARSGKAALALAGVAVLPALPVSRSAAAQKDEGKETGDGENGQQGDNGQSDNGQQSDNGKQGGDGQGKPEGSPRDPAAERYDRDDPSDCFYWRYCNMHGTMCTTCPGGGLLTCPTGSEIGQEYWIGCCTHPDTGQTYAVAYIDCCGKTTCGEGCGEGWMQASPYDPQMPSLRNDVLWCQSDESQAYTCTMAPIIAEGCDPENPL